MSSKTKVNVYRFEDWEKRELCEACGVEEVNQEVLNLAIMQADERSRRYFMPCTWQAYENKQGQLIVKRFHN